MDYCLTADGLVIFMEMIYVSDNNEFKKLILREYHAKPYLGYPSYQNMITTVKKFYYWTNLKRDIAKFMARCLDCQQFKVECKRIGGLLQPILIP